MAASPSGARSKISDSVFKNPGIYIYIYIYIYIEIMFYLYILVHALFSFYIICLYDYSVLEIYINVTVNSNSVRNYCSYKEMK